MWRRAAGSLALLADASARRSRPPPTPSGLLTPACAVLSRLLSTAAACEALPTPGGGFFGEIGRRGCEEEVAAAAAEEVERRIPVKAYFLSTSIDLKRIQAETAYDVVPPSSRSLNYIALHHSDSSSEAVDSGVNESRYNKRYVVVFQYGSVVLFNIHDHEVEQYLDIVRKHASGVLPELRKDDYTVVEKPSLGQWMEEGLDLLVLKRLDIDGIRIIASVLGQSIALDHYICQVYDIVEEFTVINRIMATSGTFDMRRKKLFQLVGKANSILADVIRLGLFDRSEIAWKNAHYAQILEYLSEEYELSTRFSHLEIKLKFVEHNIHFLQEALQNRRSDLLEWCVILLLSIDIILQLYDIMKNSSMIS